MTVPCPPAASLSLVICLPTPDLGMERLTLLLTLASACFGQAEPRPEKRNSPDGSEAGARRVGAPSERPPLVSREWTFCPREATDCPRAADGCAPCTLSRTMSEVHDSSLLLLPPPNRELGLVSVCTVSPAFHGLLDEDSAHGARSSFSSFRFALQNACRQLLTIVQLPGLHLGQALGAPGCTSYPAVTVGRMSGPREQPPDGL